MPASHWFRLVLLEKSAESLFAAGALSLPVNHSPGAPSTAVLFILPPDVWAMVFTASAALMLAGIWRSNIGQAGLCLATIVWGVWLFCYAAVFLLTRTTPIPMMLAAFMTLSNFLILAAPAVRRWN